MSQSEQNTWTSASAPLSWGIYRNIPFAILGVLIVVLFYRSAGAMRDEPFRFLWLTVVLSFACYIPVCCSGVCSFGTGNRCEEKYGICCQTACCRRFF